VLLPAPDGGQERASQRLVFSLDGMGIAEAAPRAMSGALEKALQASNIGPEEVRLVIPHQAGAGIVRFTGMKLEELGIRGTLINGLTKNVGNVSSCSIPYALKQHWDQLHGTIACPTAAVGAPGKAETLQGCTLLCGTRHHDRMVRRVA
jgi:3-oxoacyl-[acyl-carrier-protein] synthase III